MKTLLNDRGEDIRKSTARAISDAYRGHPVHPEKVDEAYTAALVSIATDRRHPRHDSAVFVIARTRTPEGVKAAKTLLADPNAQVPMTELDLGVRTIRDLLRDDDPDVRRCTQDDVKGALWESRGRPLRPEDFPAEFHEDREAIKKRVLEQWLKGE